MAAEERSQLLKTAYSIIDGYNAWDMDKIMGPRAPECTQIVLPERLQRPAMGNDTYRQYFTGVMDQFKNYHIHIIEAVEDQKRHKVTFHMKSTAETAIGEYENEFAIFVHMTEDDSKVVHIKEFVDSGYSIDFFQKLRAHKSKSA